MTVNSAVLVLNRYYQPVHVTSVKRAFSLLYQGVAKAIDAQYRLYEFDDWAALSATQDCITTINRTIRVPRVLVLSAYDHLPRGRVRFSRLNIYARDVDTCQYCGKNLPRSELNLDHVLPRSQGGKTTWENVVCSCVPCNLKKGGRTPEQAKMPAPKTLYKPRVDQLPEALLMRVTWRPGMPDAWKSYMRDTLYWKDTLDE